MDALASLAFGIVVINVIRGLGVTEPGAIAKNTVLSGIFSCLFMGGIYVAVTIVGPRATPLPSPAPTAARPLPSSLSTIWGGPDWWCWL